MAQTILVADDSKTLRTIFEWTFKGTPYQAHIVEGGAEVFAALQRVRPSLIIVDYNMADREGYDVCQALKSNPQTAAIPVLMLGGKFAEFSEERAGASGADDFIIKPFRTDALMKKVEALLAKGAAGDVKQLAAAPAARPAPPATPAPGPTMPAAPPAAPGAAARPRFPFPGQAPGTPPAAPARPAAPEAHTPQPGPAPVAAAAASADPAALREEVQGAVKELLPTIVRGVLKELISKEVMPGLQQWVEKRLDALVEQKVRAEIERLRRGG